MSFNIQWYNRANFVHLQKFILPVVIIKRPLLLFFLLWSAKPDCFVHSERQEVNLKYLKFNLEEEILVPDLGISFM